MMQGLLHEIQAGQGAHFEHYHSRQIADHFGDALREYGEVRQSVGVFDLSYIGKLRVTGRDRAKYLNNMLSNDIKNLSPGNGCHATLLNHQGHMEADLYVYAREEDLFLECPPGATADVLATLNRFIVSDVVMIEDLSDRFGICSLQGPRCAEFVGRITGGACEALDPLQHKEIATGSSRWMAVRRDRTGCDGYDVWLPLEDLVEFWRDQVVGGKIPPAGHRVLNWLRTEAGIPWYGVDMHEKSLPMEMGLEDAISMTKGCYRGQEIVARVMHRGHLNRRLGGVTLEGDEIPVSGTEIRVNGTKVGEVTSAIFSPRLRMPLALALLKMDFLASDTWVEIVSGDSARPGRVIRLPLDR